MANLNNKKTIGAPFSNSIEIVRVIYDFAVDGGAIGTLEALEAQDNLVIHGFYAKGITVLDSTADGSSIDVGIQSGNVDILLDGVVEATFAADAIIQATIVDGTPPAHPMPLSLPSGGIIDFEIKAEAS